MIFKKIDFNVQWVASKTLKQFIEHEKHHGLTKEEYAEIHKVCKDLQHPAAPDPGSVEPIINE